jgi:hypothetical protein
MEPSELKINLLDLSEDILIKINGYIRHVERMILAQTCSFFRSRLFAYSTEITLPYMNDSDYMKVLPRYPNLTSLTFRDRLPPVGAIRHLNNIRKFYWVCFNPIDDDSRNRNRSLGEFLLTQPLIEADFQLQNFPVDLRGKLVGLPTLQCIRDVITLQRVSAVNPQIHKMTILIKDPQKHINFVELFSKFESLRFLRLIVENFPQNILSLKDALEKIKKMCFLALSLPKSMIQSKDEQKAFCELTSLPWKEIALFCSPKLIMLLQDHPTLEDLHLMAPSYKLLPMLPLLYDLKHKISYKTYPKMTIKELETVLKQKIDEEKNEKINSSGEKGQPKKKAIRIPKK